MHLQIEFKIYNFDFFTDHTLSSKIKDKQDLPTWRLRKTLVVMMMLTMCLR